MHCKFKCVFIKLITSPLQKNSSNVVVIYSKKLLEVKQRVTSKLSSILFLCKIKVIKQLSLVALNVRHADISLFLFVPEYSRQKTDRFLLLFFLRNLEMAWVVKNVTRMDMNTFFASTSKRCCKDMQWLNVHLLLNWTICHSCCHMFANIWWNWKKNGFFMHGCHPQLCSSYVYNVCFYILTKFCSFFLRTGIHCKVDRGIPNTFLP